MIVNSSLLEEIVKEAIELINDKSISVRSYVCDPESCGHRLSQQHTEDLILFKI